MNLQLLLENELVKIRPLSPQDLQPLYEIAKDPKIWEQHPCKRNVRREFEKFFQESIESNGALTILDKKSGDIIGSSRFKSVEGVPNGVEIGYTFIGRKYWGGNYNRAVKDLMIEHAFKFVDNVLFYVAKENIRSQKAVKKIGGRKVSESDTKVFPKKGAENEKFIITQEYK